MISDTERREVARRLRKNAEEHPDMSILLNVAFADEGTRPDGAMDWNVTSHDAAMRLADLIEPEPERTCRMGAPIDGEYRCSECGHLNRETYRPDKGWFKPRYCAHCGARVVGNQ